MADLDNVLRELSLNPKAGILDVNIAMGDAGEHVHSLTVTVTPKEPLKTCQVNSDAKPKEPLSLTERTCQEVCHDAIDVAL